MNIHDIAKEAGVSIATVSRVLNNSPAVQESTRSKVQAVIEARAYTPNALARGLLQNRTKSVGVLIVDILNPYYATVVHSIERHLSARGSSILLCNTGGSHREKLRYIQTLLEKRVDGLVFVGSVYREKDGNRHILEAARKVPVVMINSVIEAANIFCILCDDRAGIRRAAEYLLAAGKRRILFINTTQTLSARIKEEEFSRVLDERGIPAGERLTIETRVEDLNELPQAISSSLRSFRCDAILATDDLFANVAVNTLHSLRQDMPGRIWVLGYNNSYVSEQTFPRLSSVDSRMQDLGSECAAVLARVLAGEAPEPAVQFLAPRLVIKDSSGPAALTPSATGSPAP